MHLKVYTYTNSYSRWIFGSAVTPLEITRDAEILWLCIFVMGNFEV